MSQKIPSLPRTRGQPVAAPVPTLLGQVTAAGLNSEAEQYIIRRATQAKQSKSKFAGWIINDWIARGAPAVHETDRVILPVPKL